MERVAAKRTGEVDTLTCISGAAMTAVLWTAWEKQWEKGFSNDRKRNIYE
jgi:hypothetical protein